VIKVVCNNAPLPDRRNPLSEFNIVPDSRYKPNFEVEIFAPRNNYTVFSDLQLSSLNTSSDPITVANCVVAEDQMIMLLKFGKTQREYRIICPDAAIIKQFPRGLDYYVVALLAKKSGYFGYRIQCQKCVVYHIWSWDGFRCINDSKASNPQRLDWEARGCPSPF
jgi:hypothetical protein